MRLTNLLLFLQGVKFDYHNKGGNIPPPKDRMPDTENYMEMQASGNAHIIQDAPEGYQQQYNMS